METPQAIAFVLAPMYALIGLSILLNAKAWQRLYAKWADDHFGLFTLMLMMIIGGLIVIYLYNVWAWNVWLLVTLSGWGMFLKGAFFFLAPGDMIKPLFKLGQNTTLLYLGGVVALIFGAVLYYFAFFA